jgi:hypothetical protein
MEKIMNTKIYLLVILTVFAISTAPAEQYTNLDIEDYYFSESGSKKYLCTPEDECRWMPREGLYSEPWLSDDAYTGSNSLAIQLPAADDNPNVANRCELYAVPADDINVLKYGEKKYFGFAMKLDEFAFDEPYNWCLFMQVFQNQSPSDFPPPLALDFKMAQDNPLQFELKTSDNDNLGSRIVRYTGDFERGEWYEFVLGLKPGYSNDGTIELWLDGVKVFDAQQDWGYEPGTYDDEGEDIEVFDSFNFRVGLYRREQPRNFTVYYDDIKYADNFLEAVPGCGDGGFLEGDINRDCSVDLFDFAVLAKDWLQDTLPVE